MIFDRTQKDVDDAVLIRKEKVQKFIPLTSDEVDILEKGTITINTLNRIEEKQNELKYLFNEIGYWNTKITNKVWTNQDIFDAVEFQRIIDNTNTLRNAFIVYKDTPNTPGVSYHWQDINALERILNDLDIMINDVKSHYRECGTFECGEELLND